MARIFKIKAFARFQRDEQISDTTLAKAIGNADRGLIDADLGGGLIKQRVARAGEGRSGGFRTVIAFRRGDRAVFLYGFAKKERRNIGMDELEVFKQLAREYLEMSVEDIGTMLDSKKWIEVKNEKPH